MIQNPNIEKLERIIQVIMESGSCSTKHLTYMTGYKRRLIQEYKKWIKENKPEVIRTAKTLPPVEIDDFIRTCKQAASPQTHEQDRRRTLPLKNPKDAREITVPLPIREKNVRQGTGRKHRLVVGLPDLHLPYSHRAMFAPSARAAMRFCDDMRPDEVVLMGDYMDLKCVSHWNKEFPGRVENDYLVRDFNIANMVLDMIQGTTDKVTYMEGNHERWLVDYTDKDPHGLRGMIDLREKLRLYDRGIDLIPENGVYRVGEARLILGWYTNVHHAKKTVDAAMTNIFYGHTHDIQSYSKVKRPGHQPIIGQSCGCLCDQNPHYLRNRPNRWASGFLILHIRDDGTFTYYVPCIVGGFIYNGKEYAA